MVQQPLNPGVLEAARQLLDRTTLRWPEALQLGAALAARDMFPGTEITSFPPPRLCWMRRKPRDSRRSIRHTCRHGRLPIRTGSRDRGLKVAEKPVVPGFVGHYLQGNRNRARYCAACPTSTIMNVVRLRLWPCAAPARAAQTPPWADRWYAWTGPRPMVRAPSGVFTTCSTSYFPSFLPTTVNVPSPQLAKACAPSIFVASTPAPIGQIGYHLAVFGAHHDRSFADSGSR